MVASVGCWRHVRWKNLASHGERLGELAIAYKLGVRTGLENELQVEGRRNVQVWREPLEEMARYGRIWTPGWA
jgi:hypothetical protein